MEEEPLMDFDLLENLRPSLAPRAELAGVSGGAVPKSVEKACGERYLLNMIVALPNAIVVALGGKAERRLRDLGRPANIVAQHPYARPNTRRERSWRDAAARFHAMIDAR